MGGLFCRHWMGKCVETTSEYFTNSGRRGTSTRQENPVQLQSSWKAFSFSSTGLPMSSSSIWQPGVPNGLRKISSISRSPSCSLVAVYAACSSSQGRFEIFSTPRDKLPNPISRTKPTSRSRWSQKPTDSR